VIYFEVAGTYLFLERSFYYIHKFNSNVDCVSFHQFYLKFYSIDVRVFDLFDPDELYLRFYLKILYLYLSDVKNTLLE